MRPRPAEVLARLGQTASSRRLVAVCGRRAVTAAVADGSIRRVARGHYALPGLADPRLAAEQLRGVVSHVSAARLWGLDVVSVAPAAHVTVPVHRKRRATGAVVHWLDLSPAEIHDGMTTPERTVLDCARSLPFVEALPVADSALRRGLLSPSALVAAAEGARGPGSRGIDRIARAADGRAASALESVLRAHLIQAGLHAFEPQVPIRGDDFFARVDLADRAHRIVLEADSFEHHGSRTALVRDCRRYDELVVRGWLVLRFAWEHVMFEPDWVVSTIRAALAMRPDRPTGPTTISVRARA